MEHRPTIGITIGDFNGIGPEIIMKVFSDSAILKFCTPIIYGSSKILQKYRKLLNTEDNQSQQFFYIKSADQHNNKKINLINCWEEDHHIEPGKVTEIAGKCAYAALKLATEDLRKGWIDAIVTCPINKANIQSEEFKFPGHTEYFAHHFSQGKENLMLMVHDELRVAVVTGHMPLSKVPQALTKELLASKLSVFFQSLKSDFAKNKPKVALLGLNPHAGESGLLGSEENDIIIPVIEEFKKKGEYVFGPYPADAFFGNKLDRKFDGVLAMYHDQGLIPFKALAFDSGVNFSAGMPIVRTSPDHGTAYDIAGKGVADENSLRQAIFLVTEIFGNRRKI
ncbi:MAG TPA: 4-hydroxythreonine-4-phosphate dehydrogenase PdxA [Cytophagales bacterium]|nr:4-hydroxythreonine-4-phosphate dehydrogenase PdxA [Cytophagales bacterium]